MRFGLRMVAQALLMLTSIGVYGALGALHAPGGVLSSIVLVALLAFVAILAHELAHAVAAHRVGARVHAIVAFPVRLRMQPRRLELIRRGAHHGGDLGGYVSYTLDRIDTRRKRAIIAAAGPAANLALALLAGFMAPMFDRGVPAGAAAQALVPAGAWQACTTRPALCAVSTDQVMLVEVPRPIAPPVVAILLSAFALLSGGLGLANLIPFAGSDGDQIANLWRRPKRTWR